MLDETHRAAAVLAPEDRIESGLDSDLRLVAVALEVAQRAESESSVGILPVVNLVDLEATEALPLLEDGIMTDFQHRLVVYGMLEQLVVTLLGAAGLEQVQIFGLAAFVETFCKNIGQGLDVVVVEGVGRNRKVHSDVIFRSREGQVAAVVGEDASAHSLGGVYTGDLDVVLVVAHALVEELQLHHPSDCHYGYQEEEEINQADSDNVIAHRSPKFFEEGPQGPSGP